MSITFEKQDPALKLADLGDVYFVGIGGAGMSVIARMFQTAGLKVSGADTQSNAVTASLSLLGMTIYQGHAQDQVGTSQTIVVSSAVRQTNPEFQFARAHGLRVLHRSQALALLMQDHRAIAVAGAHGKTSTSAMIAVGAQNLGLDPSYAIGGSVITAAGQSPGGRLGSGDVLIAEADESDGSFLNYAPYVAVVTNIEADHLDHYGTQEAFEGAFDEFARQVNPNGALVACIDDPGAARLVLARKEAGARVITYGQDSTADVRIINPRQEPGSVDFSCRLLVQLRAFGSQYPEQVQDIELTLGVPGIHNALNAAGAVAALIYLGQEPGQAAASLTDFAGTGRRFELRGQVGDIQVIDDYAHHPTEVSALLAAARVTAGTGRVLTLFQPHLFSRTKSFAQEFADALSASDVTVLTSIYAAREDFDPSVSAQTIAQFMTSPVAVENESERAALKIAQLAQPGDLILTVGAGDVTTLAPTILTELARLYPQETDA